MIMDLIKLVWLYFAMLWEAITNALKLNPEVLQVVEQYPWSAWVVAGIVFLAGASTLLGQSAVLFINRVRKSRFVISLVTNGFIFIVSYIVWGFIVWLVGFFLFDINPPFGQFVRMVGLSTAPLVFSFFVLIPWMGPFVGKVLNVWSLVILIGIVQFTYKIELLGRGGLRNPWLARQPRPHQPPGQARDGLAQQGLPQGSGLPSRPDCGGHPSAI